MTELKKEIEGILHPEKALHPPIAPKPIVNEIEYHETSELKGSREANLGIKVSDATSKLAIDSKTLSWKEAKEWLLTNSSLDRTLMEFVKKIIPGFEGVDPRASMKKARETFWKVQKKTKENIIIIKKMPPEVMKELKEKIKGRKIE